MLATDPVIEMRAPWLPLYEAGVGVEEIPRRSTMSSRFQEAVAKNADGIAVRYFDQKLSFADLDRASDALAATLARAGVGTGDRIAVLLQNVPGFATLAIAAWKLGAVPVPINPMYQAIELGRIFADAEPRAVLCDCRQASVVAAALATAACPALILWLDSAAGQTGLTADAFGTAGSVPSSAVDMADICARGHDGFPRVEASPDDVGLLMYTSGTTGQPKGVMISHASLAYNARLTSRWMQHGPNSIVLAMAPLFHITGFVCHFASSIDAACTMLLPYRMIAPVMLKLIRSAKPTHTVGAITAFNALMSLPDAGPADFASFERVYSGGAPIPPSLRDAVEARLGIALYPGFGMTETAAPTHFAPFGRSVPVNQEHGALAIGVPVPGTDAIIVSDDGATVAPGTPGELLVRGPQIMLGYRNLPEVSAATLAGGWMHTGDIAIMDALGWFYIVDRKKDVIIASGFKVWPREVEDCLYSHPGVREAAVIGAADAYRGETVVAYVSLRPDASPTVEDLTQHCRNALAAYKCPRKIVLLDDLPKTVSGKIQRSALRSS